MPVTLLGGWFSPENLPALLRVALLTKNKNPPTVANPNDFVVLVHKEKVWANEEGIMFAFLNLSDAKHGAEHVKKADPLTRDIEFLKVSEYLARIGSVPMTPH